MPMKSSCKWTPGWRHHNEKNCRTLDHLDRSRFEADPPTTTVGGYLAEGRWRSTPPGAGPDNSPERRVADVIIRHCTWAAMQRCGVDCPSDSACRYVARPRCSLSVRLNESR